jgi:hypothetical protein
VQQAAKLTAGPPYQCHHPLVSSLAWLLACRGLEGTLVHMEQAESPVKPLRASCSQPPSPMVPRCTCKELLLSPAIVEAATGAVFPQACPKNDFVQQSGSRALEPSMVRPTSLSWDGETFQVRQIYNASALYYKQLSYSQCSLASP